MERRELFRGTADWEFIHRNTLLPGMTLVLTLLALCIAAYGHAAQVKEYALLAVNHDAVHEDYDALVYRRRLVERYHRSYKVLHALGFVGVERRLDWVETIRTTASDLSLPQLNYVIEPQRRALLPHLPATAGDTPELHVSTLNLELGLVHELDLLRFFDTLQSRAPGLIRVDRCALHRQASGSKRPGTGSNLLANCRLHIYSVLTSDVSVAPAP